MSLWWLEPGWTSALCGSCGVNIWQAGGDPDHGVCPACFNRQYESAQQEEPVYYCDVCHEPGACAEVDGLAICSEECAKKVEILMTPIGS